MYQDKLTIDSPCPFCGNKEVLISEFSSKSNSTGRGLSVKCTKCWCSGPATWGLNNYNLSAMRAKAIGKWGSRAEKVADVQQTTTPYPNMNKIPEYISKNIARDTFVRVDSLLKECGSEGGWFKLNRHAFTSTLGISNSTLGLALALCKKLNKLETRGHASNIEYKYIGK